MFPVPWLSMNCPEISTAHLIALLYVKIYIFVMMSPQPLSYISDTPVQFCPAPETSQWPLCTCLPPNKASVVSGELACFFVLINSKLLHWGLNDK